MKIKTNIQPLLTTIVMVFSLLMMAPQTRAQTLDVGVFGGGSYYLGDINPNLHFVGTQAAYGGFFRFNYKDRWGFRIGATRGKLKADDQDFASINASQVYLSGDYDINDPNLIYYAVSNRGLNFETDITEVSFLFELNFFPFFVGSHRNTWTPYIFAGLSMYMYNPRPIGGGPNLRDLGTEGQGFDDRPEPYGNMALAIPFGIGVKFSLNKRLGLGFEWGIRKTYNDYIDDISSTYYMDLYGYNPDEGIYYAPNPENPAEIISFPISDEVYYSDPTFSHKKGEKRGDQYNNDWYAFFGVNLTFKINLVKDDGCRDFSRDSYL
ncbi:MAG: hypothetical protein GQ527_13350 [Bacteroidales bacterium]|nr:hypothetical protein [Bacteroidales bacterium]